jgi:hypothetical protein
MLRGRPHQSHADDIFCIYICMKYPPHVALVFRTVELYCPKWGANPSPTKLVGCTSLLLVGRGQVGSHIVVCYTRSCMRSIGHHAYPKVNFARAHSASQLTESIPGHAV